MKRIDSFSNTYIPCKIMLIIQVLVISIERCFSMLKMIIIYLRSIISQQRLN